VRGRWWGGVFGWGRLRVGGGERVVSRRAIKLVLEQCAVEIALLSRCSLVISEVLANPKLSQS